MHAPQISIVTTCLNDAGHLGETMESIHGQGYPNLEHIVIDGGSADGSVDIIKTYSDHLAYWCSEPDSGHADGLWKGLRKATGEIVTWVCSNDLLLPGSLEAVATCFRNDPGLPWAVGHGLVIDEDSNVLARIWGLPFTFWSIMFWLPWGACQPAVFMRRQAVVEAGGIDKTLNVSVDTDLFLRLAKIGRPARINHFLAALRFHKDSQTSRLAREITETDNEIRKRQGMPPLPPFLRKLIYRFYDLRFRGYQWLNELCRRNKEYPIATPVTA